ncbi:MAG: DUF748 domain-containing protein [Bacteroidales bacterium]|nr:DUF748 domain-containing protein [Bacteroidales bacterium]
MKIPAWLLKKGVKIPLIIILSILLLLILINIIAPPVAHSYIEKHSKELCHRTVTLDKLRMNIFIGKLKIEGLKALEENDKDVMLSFDALDVRINLFKLLAKEVRLNKIALDNPRVSVWQMDSVFNFTDIIEFYSDDEDDEDTTSSGWVVDLRKISISKGSVVYQDLVRKSIFDLRDFSVNIPRLYFGGKSSDIGVAFKLANGGDIAFQMLYGMDDNSYKLNIDINRLAISAFQPYLKSMMNVGDVTGELSTQMTINGNLNHILEIVANGNLSLADLNINTSENEKLLKLGNLSVNVDKIDIKENQLYFDEIAFDRAEINCSLYEDGNTFSRLFSNNSEGNSEEKAETENISADESVEATSENESQSNPMDLKINTLRIDNSSFIVYDNTLEQKFEFPVTSISMNATGVTLNDVFKAKLKAVVGSGGELLANWEGTLNGYENHKIFLKLQNFKMADISPYCLHYTAYPVASGILTFASRTLIKNSNLDSKNTIDIFNCKVENKNKEIKPEYKIPLKAALYILTDRKGKIAMSLPVKGNVSDPDFSLRKIIWKTIGNFLLKVVTAPTDFLASMFNGKDDVFNDIQMNLTDRSISSENYDKLNAMSEILKEKSEMKLSIKQSIDLNENEKLFATILATSDTAAINEAILKSVERRNQMLLQYFEVQGIPAANVEILPTGEMSSGKGKANFSFSVSVPMDEPLDELEAIE